MKVIAFLADFFMVDGSINYLKLTFAAATPPPLEYDGYAVGHGVLNNVVTRNENET